MESLMSRLEEVCETGLRIAMEDEMKGEMSGGVYNKTYVGIALYMPIGYTYYLLEDQLREDLGEDT